MSDLIDRAEAISRAVELRMYGKPVKMVAVSELERLPSAQADVTDINVGDINKFIDGLEEIFADIRERHVDDSVCGLCEYDGAYMGQSGDWCNECPGFDRDDCFKLSDECRKRWIDTIANSLPSVRAERGENSPSEQPQMNELGVKTGGTCADTISRQAAIDAMCELMHHWFGGDPKDEIREIKRELEKLPSGQPEPQWIPCSERLPECGKDVLVTRDYDGREDNNKSCRYVEVASCYGEDDDITWSSFSDEYKMKPKNHHVIAWMPLPEPWEEEE